MRLRVQGLGLDTSYVKRTRCKYCADAYSTTRTCKSDLMILCGSRPRGRHNQGILATSNPYNKDPIAIT